MTMHDFDFSNGRSFCFERSTEFFSFRLQFSLLSTIRTTFFSNQICCVWVVVAFFFFAMNNRKTFSFKVSLIPIARIPTRVPVRAHFRESAAKHFLNSDPRTSNSAKKKKFKLSFFCDDETHCSAKFLSFAKRARHQKGSINLS